MDKVDKGTTRKTCCHPCCVRGGPEADLVSIPTDHHMRSDIALALRRNFKDIKDKDVRLCRVHLVDPLMRSEDIRAGSILPFNEDPVVLGRIEGRNAHGKDVHEKIKKLAAEEEADALEDADHTEFLERKVTELKEKVKELNLKLRSYTSAKNRAQTPALAPQKSLRMFSFEYLIAKKDRCERYTTFTPKKLVAFTKG